MLPLQHYHDVLSDPWLLAILTAVVVAVAYLQRTLSWSEYRVFQRVKIRVLPVIDRYTSAFVVARKFAPDTDAEYVTAILDPPREVWQRLVDAGGSPHLISSIKVRPHPETGDPQYAVAHVVWLHDDGTQTEAYLFRAAGGTDVYAHHEGGVLDPEEHLTAKQRNGDVRGVVRDALGVA